MSNPIVLSSSGVPFKRFGGDDAWKQFEVKGYIVSLETVEEEPAMVIWPASASLGAGAYAVCMSAFPHWVGLDGKPTTQAFIMAAKGLAAMNRPMLDVELHALVDVVMRHIPDVYRMPNRRKRDDPNFDPMFDVETHVDGRGTALSAI